jgi:hypothetical protein
LRQQHHQGHHRGSENSIDDRGNEQRFDRIQMNKVQSQTGDRGSAQRGVEFESFLRLGLETYSPMQGRLDWVVVVSSFLIPEIKYFQYYTHE